MTLPSWEPSVYPRVCGGTRSALAGILREEGLSPRVRGNLRERAPSQNIGRSIPACAGEPPPDDRLLDLVGVYPRVCGGTCRPRYSAPSGSGLSPRVRGNLTATVGGATLTGSIPACAGEPPRHRHSERHPGVYPRVCGGTRLAAAVECGRPGLSPRVRGNRRPEGGHCDGVGSIPACAGEPYSRRRRG